MKTFSDLSLPQDLFPRDIFDNYQGRIEDLSDVTGIMTEGVEIAIARLESVLKGELSTARPVLVWTEDPAEAGSQPDQTFDFVIEHNDGCCCVACGGMRPEDEIPADDGTGLAPGSVAPSTPVAAAPAGTLSEMADFLTTDFWTQYGTVPREFNLTSSGLNPKSGVLHYNVTGFSGAGSAGTDLTGLTTARANLVRDVLDVYSAILGISFVETTSSSVNVTDLFFMDNNAGAYANSVGASTGIQYSWVNVAASWSGGTSTYNDYTLQTIFHEVGHALGLGHQGLYNGSGTYATDADFEGDSWQASMMSYFSQTENTSITASYAFLQTPMSVDWIALQDMYGDQSFGGTTFGTGNAFLGNTIYGFNTNISASVSNIWAEFSNYAHLTASTIIDAGGIDTLDVSGYSANQVINLTVTSQNDYAPSVSDIGGLIGNLTLADGTVIENAVGGSGNDIFYGNSADNSLTGNAGDDTFYDSAGADTYDGGADIDTVSYANATQGVGIRLNGTAGWMGALGDLMFNIENLIGSLFADTLAGNASANVIEAGDGDDTIYANNGDDTIDTGLGADTVYGQGGVDTVTYATAALGVGIALDGTAGTGGASGDQLFGVENLIGSAFADTLTGNGSSNTINAGAGDDTIIVGAAADTIDGGADTDTASYANATQGVGIKLDGSAGWGGANGDTLTGIENLTGSAFADTLVGDGAANVIEGGDGADTIYGNGGDDIILGGLGADLIYGQGGIDTASYADATQGVIVALDGSAGSGGASGDQLFGIENLIGSAFGDTLTGSGGANVIAAGDGDDTILGGAGADTIDGEAGTDTASYADATSGVGIKLDGSAGWGGANGDTLTGVENLTGSAFGDTLVGDGGGNFLDGGDGNDTIYAKNGADILVGGAGDDILYGQGGSDIFAFADGFGVDTIHGFDAIDANEKLYLLPLTTIADYTALTTNGHMSQVGADVVIDDFAGNTITLVNVTLADLDQSDFIF